MYVHVCVCMHQSFHCPFSVCSYYICVLVFLCFIVYGGCSSLKYGLIANRYHFCEKCFNEIQGNSVTLGEDPAQPQTSVKEPHIMCPCGCFSMACILCNVTNMSLTKLFLCRMISKEQFEKKKNDTLDAEPWVLPTVTLLLLCTVFCVREQQKNNCLLL